MMSPIPSRPNSPLTGGVISVAAIAVALFLWQGVVRRPTPPAFGDGLHAVTDVQEAPDAADARATLRVATFNIAGGVSPRTEKCDLNRTAAVLRDFDLIGLEEVHGRSVLDSRDQAQVLGENLHVPWLFAPSESRWWHDAFGNGALCALPVARWERLPLSTTLAASNRSLLRLTAEWRRRPLTVLVTHLDRHEDHDAELGAVLAAFRDAPTPVVLLADLNTTAADPRLKAFRADPAIVDAIGQSLGDCLPPDNVDWIFARGMKYVAGGLRENNASDHRLAWAELAE